MNKKNTFLIHKFGYIPVRHSALNSIECKAFDLQNPNYKIPIESLEYARTLHTHPELYKINRLIRAMLKEIVLGDSEPLIVLRKTEKEINEMIK